MASKAKRIRSIAFVSLGCPKNLVDSERMLGLLAADGLAVTPHHEEADAIVINTCGFLEASRTESLDAIRQAIEHKKTGKCQRVVVAGCLVQRHKTKLLADVPEVDRLVGVFDREHIVEAVRGKANPRQEHGHFLGKYHDLSKTLEEKSSREGSGFGVQGSGGAGAKALQTGTDSKDIDPEETTAPCFSLLNPEPRTLNPAPPRLFEDDRARLRLTPRHYAYLRISEGCNQGCAFCTIPSIRGPMRSKPITQILAEARELAADGAIELNLIGQDTTSYGSDIGDPHGLSGLLRTLDRQLTDVHWLRLMYAYPSCFTDDMIDALAESDRVVKYIDMPLQHINDNMLSKMRRRVTRAQIETLLEKLRTRIPNLAIRTTFIAGSPGETDEQHAELVAFVRDFQFDMMGVFPFSQERGTPMGRMEDQLPDEVKTARVEELMLAQQQVAFDRARRMKGKKIEVLIDRPAGRDVEDAYVARSQSQAPNIDSVVYLDSATPLHPGQLVDAKVTDFQAYDLIAQHKPAKQRTLTVLK